MYYLKVTSNVEEIKNLLEMIYKVSLMHGVKDFKELEDFAKSKDVEKLNLGIYLIGLKD